jgi:hypothetical protein
MMIGPYPRSPDRIDGGAASALTYLSQALLAEPGVELVGVRVAANDTGSNKDADFGWPIANLIANRCWCLRRRGCARRVAVVIRRAAIDEEHWHQRRSGLR